jgi:hypothetical protein
MFLISDLMPGKKPKRTIILWSLVCTMDGLLFETKSKKNLISSNCKQIENQTGAGHSMNARSSETNNQHLASTPKSDSPLSIRNTTYKYKHNKKKTFFFLFSPNYKISQILLFFLSFFLFHFFFFFYDFSYDVVERLLFRW